MEFALFLGMVYLFFKVGQLEERTKMMKTNDQNMSDEDE